IKLDRVRSIFFRQDDFRANIVLGDKVRKKFFNEVPGDCAELLVNRFSAFKNAEMNRRPCFPFCSLRYFFTDNDVLVLAHREFALFKTAVVPIDTLYMEILEIFQASEAAKALATSIHFKVGIKRVEGIAVYIIKPYAVVFDFKAVDFR